ncbi:MAG TPA: hypothetical protein VN512_11505 [Clostridia bacterium]|nr:hypothetical protein [Clostridia bacterium]
MRYPYVCKADAEKKYNENGFSKVELPLDADFPDVKKSDIHFYRCNLKAGRVVRPELDKDRIVLLIFNGKNSYVKYGEDTFRVTEPAFFIPDFDRQAYTVGAIEDTEFIIGVFGMNEWDRSNYKKWHKHLPFFTLYTDAVQYDQACKKPGTRSWTILQGMQLGHISIGVVHAIGAGTDEKGHIQLHQWNYCLGNSDFTLDVEGNTEEQRAGDFSFIYAGKDHKLLAKPDKEVFYCWVEYYTTEDLTEYWKASIHNESVSEAYARIVANAKKS